MRINWKTIIIDDEELARRRLKRLLKGFEEFTVLAVAENGVEGLKLINELHPDLIFLDIEMPVLNGFEMLARLKKQPHVVFTTAYDQYAIKAFEENSIDYLLKPIEAERLEKTVLKLRQYQDKRYELPILELIQHFEQAPVLKTLTVKIGDKIWLIKLNEIIYAEAEDKYVFLHTTDGKKHLTDYTLTALEDKLPDNYLRIHRGAIINTDWIKEIRKGFNGTFVFVMNGQHECRINSSRANKELLKTKLGMF